VDSACSLEVSGVAETRTAGDLGSMAMKPRPVEPTVPGSFRHRFSRQQHRHCPSSGGNIKMRTRL
jgi:hypothetical protein